MALKTKINHSNEEIDLDKVKQFQSAGHNWLLHLPQGNNISIKQINKLDNESDESIALYTTYHEKPTRRKEDGTYEIGAEPLGLSDGIHEPINFAEMKNEIDKLKTEVNKLKNGE